MKNSGVSEKKQSVYNKTWTEGPIVRNILLLSWPMALLETLFVISQAADMIWVGRLGAPAIAAMGIAFTVIMLAMSLDFGLVVGARAMVARYVGAGDIATANHIAAQAIILAAAWGFIMAALGVTLAGAVVGMFGLDPEVSSGAIAYIRISFAGWVIMDVMVIILYIVQASGDAVRPMVIEGLTRGIHVLLCPFLVLGLWIFPRLGIGGAALSSVIAQVIGAVFAGWLLFGGATRLHVKRRDFRLDLSIIGRILKIGVPALTSNLQRSIAGFVVTLLMARFGTMAMAAHSLYSRIEMFIMLPGFGLGMGAGVLVGQNLGAGQPQRAEKSAWLAAFILEGFMLFCIAILLLWASGVLSIFTSDQELIKLAANYLRIGTVGFAMLAFSSVLQSSLAGAGDTVPNMIFVFIIYWVIQVPLALLLSNTGGLGVLGIRWALAASIAAGAVIYIIYFRLGRWKSKKV